MQLINPQLINVKLINAYKRGLNILYTHLNYLFKGIVSRDGVSTEAFGV
jgi:hypothetical protein